MNAILSLRTLAVGSALLLSACAHHPTGHSPEASRALPGAGYIGPGSEAEKVEVVAAPAEDPYKPIVIRVTGVGAAPYSNELTPTQRKLLAMRASKLDAYRAIAEQLQGVRLVGGSSVANLVAVNDSFRVYVDAYLRGINIIDTSLQPDGSSQTIAEITLEQDFYQAFKNSLVRTGSVKESAESMPVVGSETGRAISAPEQPKPIPQARAHGTNYYVAY